MAKFDTSKSQRRAAAVLGIDLDPYASYASAGYILEAAGAPADGIPLGHDWRSAGKLADADLRAALLGTQSALAEYHQARVDLANN